MRQAAPGGARASSETMAWYSQSSRKFVFAKRTHTRRAVRTMYAAVRITYRMTERMPCARAFFGAPRTAPRAAGPGRSGPTRRTPGWRGSPARRMVQVHVPKRTLEGVFLALLAPVAPHQLLQRQVVARHQDHRVPRDQKPLAVLRPAPNHHVVLLPVPPARAVRREDRLLGKRAKPPDLRHSPKRHRR